MNKIDKNNKKLHKIDTKLLKNKLNLVGKVKYGTRNVIHTIFFWLTIGFLIINFAVWWFHGFSGRFDGAYCIEDIVGLVFFLFSIITGWIAFIFQDKKNEPLTFKILAIVGLAIISILWIVEISAYGETVYTPQAHPSLYHLWLQSGIWFEFVGVILTIVGISYYLTAKVKMKVNTADNDAKLKKEHNKLVKENDKLTKKDGKSDEKQSENKE